MPNNYMIDPDLLQFSISQGVVCSVLWAMMASLCRKDSENTFSLKKYRFTALSRSDRACEGRPDYNWRDCLDEEFYLRKGKICHTFTLLTYNIWCLNIYQDARTLGTWTPMSLWPRALTSPTCKVSRCSRNFAVIFTIFGNFSAKFRWHLQQGSYNRGPAKLGWDSQFWDRPFIGEMTLSRQISTYLHTISTHIYIIFL